MSQNTYRHKIIGDAPYEFFSGARHVLLDFKVQFLSSLRTMSETWLLQFLFGICACVSSCVCACIRPSGIFRAKIFTFMHGFQNDLEQLISVRSGSAV